MDKEEERESLNVKPSTDRNLKPPTSLHQLESVNMASDKPEPVIPNVPKESWYDPDEQCIQESYKKDLAWILSRLVQQQPEVQNVPGWTGFNQLLSRSAQTPTVVGPLPIVNAPAHEFETLWTVISKCQAMTHSRQAQYTVVTLDEALYCKAKMLQWSKSHECRNLVVMLGGFHAQMTFSKVIGKYMESSGLSDMWEGSGVFGESNAENILKGKVWNRVVRAHKLSFEALWRVLWTMFQAWCEENGKVVEDHLMEAVKRLVEQLALDHDDERQLALTSVVGELTNVLTWLEEFDTLHKDDATFCYWRTYMLLVAILLRLTRALREGDWDLFLSSFAEMLPWFAAFDHVNYFRWGTAFLTDMKMLQQTAPMVYHGFQDGDFVTKETTHQFNQIPDDQALEHVNKAGKVAGGLVGISRLDAARDRWCLTYNERAQLSEDTKTMFNILRSDEEDHKDSGPTRIKRDEEDVLKLVTQFQRHDVFRETADLVAVTTGDVVTDEIKSDLLEAEQRGKAAVKDFVKERLIKKETKFHDTIKQQKLKTFESLYAVNVRVGKEKTVSIKADRDLFRRVVVALESGREVDVGELLERELSSVPLSLATLDRKLRNCASKADLSHILQGNKAQIQAPTNLDQTCTIIDGMAAIQSLGNRGKAETFGEWSDKIQLYLLSHFSDKCKRVDVVFDRYPEKSIKGGTRAKRKKGRGKGIKRKVESREQKIRSWERFISLDENKASLTHFLCIQLSERCQLTSGQELVLSGGFNDAKKVWSSTGEDVSRLESDQEEADTRIVLHARDATLRGFQQVNVVCRDTDVLLLLLAHQPYLCEAIWMFSGTAKRKCHIPLHLIELEEEKRASLLAFHALTGCDTTSQFVGVGKKSAWAVFMQYHGLLQHLGEQNDISDQVLSDAEAFVCRLYRPDTDKTSINDVRVTSFRQATKSLDSLPPTQDALQQHIRRAHLQTLIWKRALEPCPVLPHPEECGWHLEEGILEPTFMTKEPVSATCLQLAYCGCSSERPCRTQRCTCTSLNLKCSKACKCGSRCLNTSLVNIS